MGILTKITLFICLFFLSCSNPKESEWTILVFMSADNGLTQNAVIDINEMEAANFSDEMNVIVFVDYNSAVENSEAFIYEISHDESPREITSKKLRRMLEVNCGKPETISDFANEFFEKYPSENRGLILWSHSTGWREKGRSFSPDYTDSDNIDIVGGELFTAFTQLNLKVDITVLDACHLGSMEVIDEIDHRTNFIIASEEEVSSEGLPYEKIFSIWEDSKVVKEIAFNIASEFHDSLIPGGSQNLQGVYYPVSTVCIETKEFRIFKNRLDYFLSNTTFSKDEVLEALDACHTFNYPINDIDILEFFIKLNEINPDLNIEPLIFQIEKMAVYYNQFYISETVGTVSVWFPDSQTNFDAFYDSYSQLSFSKNKWLNFVGSIYSD